MRRYPSMLAAMALCAVLASPAVAQENGMEKASKMSMTAVPTSSMTFSDIDVPGFDPGMKIAVIDGNPDSKGPYTLRLSFPADYRFPPHFHPMAENLTVISGTLLLAMGEQADDAELEAYGVGDYLHIPAEHPHFGGARGATIVQLHGQGPFEIKLVRPVASSQ